MKVWDRPTRIYHWLQALLFTAMAVTGLTEEGPHITLGLALLTLLIWRIIWGIVGSETSQFRYFVRRPAIVVSYLKGQYPESVGHNPAGGYMVIVLISTILLQCLSGLALSGMLDPLPGSEIWLNDAVFDICVLIHENLLDLLFVLVAIHLFAIVVYKLKSKPLVMAMITGQQKEGTGKVSFVSDRWALAIFLIVLTIIVLLYMLSVE